MCVLANARRSVPQTELIPTGEPELRIVPTRFLSSVRAYSGALRKKRSVQVEAQPQLF